MTTVVKIKKLKGIDQRCFSGIVRANNLQRTREFDLRVFVTTGADEDKSLWASTHRELRLTIYGILAVCRDWFSGQGCLRCEFDAFTEHTMKRSKKLEFFVA